MHFHLLCGNFVKTRRPRNVDLRCGRIVCRIGKATAADRDHTASQVGKAIRSKYDHRFFYGRLGWSSDLTQKKRDSWIQFSCEVSRLDCIRYWHWKPDLITVCYFSLSEPESIYLLQDVLRRRDDVRTYCFIIFYNVKKSFTISRLFTKCIAYAINLPNAGCYVSRTLRENVL